MAKVTNLDAYRLRRHVDEALELATKPLAPAEPAPRLPTYLAAESGKVLVGFSDGSQVTLTPEHAEVWADRLRLIAQSARALAGPEGGSGV